MIFRALDVLAILLFSQIRTSEGNADDKLFDWQAKIWMDNPEVVFFAVRDDSPAGDDPGVYAYVGDKSTVINGATETFTKPMEFFWSDKTYVTDPKNARWAVNGWATDVYGFDLVSLGKDRYNFRYKQDMLRGALILVRQLSVKSTSADGKNQTDSRWVGVIKHRGQVLALRYSWISIKYVFGMPTGVNYVNLHGFPIKDCKIDYSQDVVVKISGSEKNLARRWELKSGDDPLCACDPDPTCADEVLDFKGVDACELMTELVPKVLQEDVFKSFAVHIDELADYVDKKGKLGGDEYRKVAEGYAEDKMINASCAALPDKVPSNIRKALEKCVGSLLYQMTLSEVVFFEHEDGWIPGTSSKNPLMRLSSVAQVESILYTPLQGYIQCVKTEGAVGILSFMRPKSSDTLKFIQGQVQAALMDYQSYDDVEEADTGSNLFQKALLFTNLSLLLFFFCSYCTKTSMCSRYCSCCPCITSKPEVHNDLGTGGSLLADELGNGSRDQIEMAPKDSAAISVTSPTQQPYEGQRMAHGDQRMAPMQSYDQRMAPMQSYSDQRMAPTHTGSGQRMAQMDSGGNPTGSANMADWSKSMPPTAWGAMGRQITVSSSPSNWQGQNNHGAATQSPSAWSSNNTQFR